MNIDSMTESDFSQLLSSVDDQADHHILWINISGEVFISPCGDFSPAAWAKQQNDLKLRWETFGSGNGYCGEKAASDPEYVKKTLLGLKNDWEQGKSGYVDY